MNLRNGTFVSTPEHDGVYLQYESKGKRVTAQTIDSKGKVIPKLITWGEMVKFHKVIESTGEKTARPNADFVGNFIQGLIPGSIKPERKM